MQINNMIASALRSFFSSPSCINHLRSAIKLVITLLSGIPDVLFHCCFCHLLCYNVEQSNISIYNKVNKIGDKSNVYDS
uniref:Uncharacterized protein n=1 Tax=Pararge aegeria TaxID=116150 RepID=S4PVD8_9NEOP